ncbi:ankyrin repeat domain-containing protein [Polaribacter vadi]|uniref:ankyrin repeat domain-containing protein n=1 Tax=Polaribacter TaxID=52959 RepID=UPI001C09BF59|nr:MULTISPECIES: ankyrin repeat domain-containing protein [Polaribacter]MBU3010244.1 ankyrin repeat domain-containing protein [Polaribacter vadi]MDO6740050.1 ankyrin repeat domain-containing protein [Polaribacter sp. 1_MG-2023]
MKKIILSTFICLFVFSSSSNATSLDLNKQTVASAKFGYAVNSFCKLIQMGNYDAVKALIEAGHNVNKKSTGLTPLMFAARYNKSKIAKLLIDNGAKLDTKSDKALKMTALQIAKQSKAVDVVKVIKAAYRK